jgi:hypothetical protein
VSRISVEDQITGLTRQNAPGDLSIFFSVSVYGMGFGLYTKKSPCDSNERLKALLGKNNLE